MLSAAILAGGLATRLLPLTETVPKSLIAINGEPFIAHQLRLLRNRGVTRVVLCVAHLGGMIEDYVGRGDAFDLDVDYSWDGPERLGTAGALRNALPLLDQVFFVVYGDSYLPCDYAAVMRSFHQAGKPGLMTVFRNEGQWDTSNVEFRDGRIVEYNKSARTPAMRYIDYGLGIFHRSVFAGLAAEPRDLASVYQELLAEDRLAAVEVSERFYETGSFSGLSDLSNLLSSEVTK